VLIGDDEQDVVRLGRRRFKDLESIFNNADQLWVFPELSRIKLSHSIKRSVDVFDIEPPFVAPSKSNEKSIESAGTQMSFGECQ
jgi:hypothetical protein